MKNRFDLEQDIMNCWHVVDDIDILYENVCEGRQFTDDEMANILLGLRGLYQLKFEKLFDTFEQYTTNQNGDGCQTIRGT